MATVKCSMLVNYSATGNDIYSAGYEESVYRTGVANSSTLQNAFKELCQARARFLQRQHVIVGQRYETVDPTGISDSGKDRFEGQLTAGNEAPQLAVNCRFESTDGLNDRPWFFRGLEDGNISNGFWHPTGPWVTNYDMFVTELTTNSWKMRAIDKSNPLVKIISIAANGQFQLQADIGFNAGDFLQVTRAYTLSQDLASGVYPIIEKDTALTGTIGNWIGEAVSTGKARLYLIHYPTIARQVGNPVNSRIITRKTGSPFFQSRGRR